MKYMQEGRFPRGMDAVSIGSSGGPLDALAKRYHCMISDLRLKAALRHEALHSLLECDAGMYTEAQWQDAVNYLTGAARQFGNIAEARRYLRLCLHNEAQES